MNMTKVSDWDNHTVEERKKFLEGTLAEKKMNLDLIVVKKWSDLDYFVKWRLIMYLT